jgi:hypothetical protein
MKQQDWEAELHEFLTHYGERNKIQPAHMIEFLMRYCAGFLGDLADEEDIRNYAWVFHSILSETSKKKKRMKNMKEKI